MKYNNINIIRNEITDEDILNSLEEFDDESGIELIELPSDDEIYEQIEMSGIDKNRKIIVIPYFCKNANAFTYIGEDTIYLLGSTPEKDEDVMKELIDKLTSCGYDTKEFTWKNRRIGTIIHEEGHIKTYKISDIKNINDDSIIKLQSIFIDYQNYVFKYLKFEHKEHLEIGGLLEIIAEDFRIAWGGKASIFPHKYFYNLDIRNPKFKENRLNLLRKVGLIS